MEFTVARLVTLSEQNHVRRRALLPGPIRSSKDRLTARPALCDKRGAGGHCYG